MNTAAHAQTFTIDSDVRVRVESGRIRTDAFDDGSGTLIPNVNYFAYEFGEDPKDPYFLADPGFNAIAGSGLTPILDLQLAAPGAVLANYPQLPMADRDHSPAFWTSVAQRFGDDSAVVFDLYNEPYPDGDQDTTAAWECWRDGGMCAVQACLKGSCELVCPVID